MLGRVSDLSMTQPLGTAYEPVPAWRVVETFMSIPCEFR